MPKKITRDVAISEFNKSVQMSKLADPAEWMKPRAVAKAFDVSIGTVYYWIKVKKYFRFKMVGSRYVVNVADVKKHAGTGMALETAPKAAKSA